MNYQAYDVFPTLITVFDLKDHPANKRVFDLMKNTQIKNHALVSNNGESSYAEETPNRFLSNPLIKDFNETIQQCVNIYTEQSGLTNCTIKNSWFNKMGKGGRIILHRHEFSTVSGAYYPVWNEKNCNLRFRNPIAPYKMAELSSPTMTPYNDMEQEVPGAEGRLILFPSWLEHYTLENESDERWVVSFNAFHS